MGGLPSVNGRIERLPTLPAVLANLFRALDDDHSSAQDIEKILEHDQSTTSKLLSVANSAYYGLRHEVTSIARAVVVLGLEEVRSICMGLVLSSMLHPHGFADQESAAQLWRHALAVQQAARALAGRCQGVSKDVALTAGLLHDLGWVVLMAYRPETWARLRASLAEEGLSLDQAEERLGFSHQEAGLALARHWDLPPVLAESLGWHHRPTATLPHFQVTGLVHLADLLAGGLGQGPWHWACPVDCPPWLGGALGLNAAQWRACQDEMQGRAGEMEALWTTLLGEGA